MNVSNCDYRRQTDLVFQHCFSSTRQLIRMSMQGGLASARMALTSIPSSIGL